jgi:hypothetical protein
MISSRSSAPRHASTVMMCRPDLHLHAVLDGVLGERDQHQRRAVRAQQFRRRLHREVQPRHARGHQCQVGANGLELRADGGLGAAVAAQARDGGTQVVHQSIDHLAGARGVGGDGAAHAGQRVEQEVRLHLRGQHRQPQFRFAARGLRLRQCLFTGQRCQGAALAAPADDGKAARHPEREGGAHRQVGRVAGVRRRIGTRTPRHRAGCLVERAHRDADLQPDLAPLAALVDVADALGDPLLERLGAQPLQRDRGHDDQHHGRQQCRALARGRPALAPHPHPHPRADQQRRHHLQGDPQHTGPRPALVRSERSAAADEQQRQADGHAPGPRARARPGRAEDRPALVTREPALRPARQLRWQGSVECGRRVAHVLHGWQA